MSSRLDRLRTMRDQMTKRFEWAESAVMAQLAGQLRLVLQEIDELEAMSPEVSESDDIRGELAAGLADAEVVQLASRRGQRGAG